MHPWMIWTWLLICLGMTGLRFRQSDHLAAWLWIAGGGAVLYAGYVKGML